MGSFRMRRKVYAGPRERRRGVERKKFPGFILRGVLRIPDCQVPNLVSLAAQHPIMDGSVHSFIVRSYSDLMWAFVVAEDRRRRLFCKL